MRKKKKLLMALLMALAASLLFCGTALAKSYAPARATGLKANASESKVTLTWKKASGATGYEIYMKPGSNGTYKKIVTVNTTSYTKKNLVNNKTYYFKVRSICSTGSKKYYSTSYSSVVKAKPMVKAPAAPSGLRCYQSGNGKAYLAWNKVSGVTGYAIYKYDSSTKKYVLLKKTTGTNYTVSGLKNNTTHYFKIKTYRTVKGVTRYSSKYSSPVAVKPKKLTEEVAAVHPIWYKGTVTKNVVASPADSSSKKQTVKKGTKVTVVSYGSTCKVKLPSGEQVYIKLSNLELTSEVYTTKSYSAQVKRDFPNLNGYSSSTKYLIWVSTYTQEYCLYTGSRGNWKLLRTAKVATGKASNPSAARICKITKKEDAWTYSNGTYQAPIVYFYYENAFHSRLHYPDGRLASTTIGKPVSSGCIRMYDEDIQYIYDNCPIGTTVVIY